MSQIELERRTWSLNAIRMEERRKIGPRDILEIAAIVGLFLTVTLGAHGQTAVPGVQPVGSDPTQISVSHDRHADAVSLDNERALPTLGTESSEHGESPLSDFLTTPKRQPSLGDIARNWREGHGDPALRVVWYPYD
jgi:hypothetical protein